MLALFLIKQVMHLVCREDTNFDAPENQYLMYHIFCGVQETIFFHEVVERI
jgi:hypothetical protein